MAIKGKLPWSGRIVSVQPRIRLLRSFDQRQHSYQGYVLEVEGTCGNERGRFQIAIGKGAQEKHGFQVGMEASGESLPVDDPSLETAGYYKTSKLKIVKAAGSSSESPPPFLGVLPDLETTGRAGIVVLTPRPTTPSAASASGVAGCR